MPHGMSRAIALLRHVLQRTLRDGAIHAGNLAYLALVTLLPFVLLVTAATSAFGRTDAGQMVIGGLLQALPASVAALFLPVIDEVIEARSGYLLWAGGLVAIWTVSSFVETLRDIIHRAFAVPRARGFIGYRLRSLAGTALAMLLVVALFLAQLLFVVVVKDISALLPYRVDLPGWVELSWLFAPLFMFAALWLLFEMLEPHGFRHSPGWPGALVTVLAWTLAARLLGPSLALFGDMSLTYGALSGVMVALLFFYVVGFALVFGVELNAALARPDAPS